MRPSLLLCATVLWAGVSAFKFGGEKAAPEEQHDGNVLLRGRNLDVFLDKLSYGIEGRGDPFRGSKGDGKGDGQGGGKGDGKGSGSKGGGGKGSCKCSSDSSSSKGTKGPKGDSESKGKGKGKGGTSSKGDSESKGSKGPKGDGESKGSKGPKDTDSKNPDYLPEEQCSCADNDDCCGDETCCEGTCMMDCPMQKPPDVQEPDTTQPPPKTNPPSVPDTTQQPDTTTQQPEVTATDIPQLPQPTDNPPVSPQCPDDQMSCNDAGDCDCGYICDVEGCCMPCGDTGEPCCPGDMCSDNNVCKEDGCYPEECPSVPPELPVTSTTKPPPLVTTTPELQFPQEPTEPQTPEDCVALEGLCFGDDCCPGLECGVENVVPQEDITNEEAGNALIDLGLDQQCCVPLFFDFPNDINTDNNEPKCIPGYKPLNVILQNSAHDISVWNRCCDANAYCDNFGKCVLCLKAGNVGCTSSTLEGACCGEDAMCGLNADPPPNRAEASNMCCIKNGGRGCNTGGTPERNTMNCCNDNNGYQCIEDRCVVLPGEKNCYGEDELCLGGTEGKTNCIVDTCCVKDGMECTSTEHCCNSASFPYNLNNAGFSSCLPANDGTNKMTCQVQ